MIENLNRKEIIKLLKENYIGRIGCCDQHVPHVIPITYYYDEETGNIISHTREGLKTKVLRENPNVCLQVEDIKDLNNWRSVAVYGFFEELRGITARKALHTFVENVRNKLNSPFDEDAQFVDDLSHSTHPDNDAIIYRIRPRKTVGKFEKEANNVVSH